MKTPGEGGCKPQQDLRKKVSLLVVTERLPPAIQNRSSFSSYYTQQQMSSKSATSCMFGYPCLLSATSDTIGVWIRNANSHPWAQGVNKLYATSQVENRVSLLWHQLSSVQEKQLSMEFCYIQKSQTEEHYTE